MNFKESMVGLKKLLKPESTYIKKIYLYAIYIGILSLILPIGIQATITLLEARVYSTSWIVLSLIVSAGIALSGYLQVNQMKIIENLQQKIFVRKAFFITEKTARLNYKFLGKNDPKEIMNRFFDITAIQKSITKVLISFSTALVQVVFGLTLLSIYHPLFIGFSLILIILTFFIMKYTSRKGITSSLEESDQKYEIAFWLQESTSIFTTFKLRPKNTYHLQKLNEKSEKYLDARNQHFKILKQQYTVLIFFKVIVVLFFLIVGGALVINQKINLGQFVASEIIILLLINSVEKIIENIDTVYDLFTSIKKVEKITSLPEDDIESGIFPKEDLHIKIENVSFKNEMGQATLSNFSVEIKPNDVIYMVGSNVVNQLFRALLEPDFTNEGVISINKIPLQNINQLELREKIGFLDQRERIFSGTLMDNLRLGVTDVGNSLFNELLTILELEDFVLSLPKGYDQKLLPSDPNIPMYMKERIVLFRNLLHGPELVMITDFLAHSDKDFKIRILEFMRKKECFKTILINQPINDLNDYSFFTQKIILS
jgi:ABC-type bacteriocin/lantibiotic exporter with double-glycine peptidase domain